jgi:hypothetical protein
MTTINKLKTWLEETNYVVDSTDLKEKIEELLLDENQMLKDAIIYSLDEDGHTGEWKIRFAKNYINKIS